MSAYVVGVIAGPFIGLTVGLVVVWFDPDGRLRQVRDKDASR